MLIIRDTDTRLHGSPGRSVRVLRRPRRRRAVSILWMLGILGLGITLTGVGIDSGHLYLATQQVQNAADAAALAGAAKVRQSRDATIEAAMAVAEVNFVAGTAIPLVDNPNNDPAGDIVIGRYSRETGVFTVTLTGANAVRVRARRTADSPGGRVPLLFGALVGLEGVNVERVAIAMNGGGSGAGLLALAPTGCGLSVGGNSSLIVAGGEIHVNSSSSCAVCTNGGPIINTDMINVNGNVCFSSNTNYGGQVNPGASPIPDPLAYLPAPVPGAPMNPSGVSISGGTTNLQPGYYPNGISMTNGTLNLAPGIYIVGSGGSGGQYPAGLNIKGGDFNAEGVMIYVMDGAVDIGGNGTINLTPPNPEIHNFPGASVYEHVSIFQSRTNTRQARVIGSSGMILNGSMYFPNNKVNLGGTSLKMGEQLIAHTIDVSGNGVIEVNYTGNFNAAGSNVFLVR